jgi:ABC-type lipoprotein release transport system permease subunit
MRSLGRWRSLRHRHLQDALAVAALATAVSLPVILLSVGGGVVDHEIYELQHSGYEVAVSGSGDHGIGDAHQLVQQILALPNVAAASPVLSVAVDAFPPGGGASPTLAEGVIPDQFVQTESPEESGLFPGVLPFSDPGDTGFFDNGTYQGTPDLQVMVSSPFAEVTGLGVGDTLPIGSTANESSSLPFRIIATFGVPQSVLGPTAAFALVVPLAELQYLTGYARAAGAILDEADTVQVALAGSASTNAAAINSVAGQIQQLVPYYGVSALTGEAAQLAQSSQVLTGFYLALSSVGLIVGLVFLALVLLRRVEAERRWIGVRRAIGVPSGSIARTWVGAGLLLGGAGGALGIVGGALTVLLLAAYSTGAVRTAAGYAVFDPITLGLLFLGVLALAAGASAAATRAALRIRIVEALR